MGKKEDLAAIGEYVRNFQAARDLLIAESSYLERISQSGLTPPADAVQAAGALAYISSQLMVLEDSYRTFLSSNGGQIRPPSADEVAKTTALTMELATTIRRAITVDAVLKSVTRFMTGWATVQAA